MSQNSPIADQTPADCRPKRRSYPRNRRQLPGIDLRTIVGRRIRSLYVAYLEQAKLDADKVVHKAAALRVAGLTVFIERLHNEMLKTKKHSRRLGDELVRHENMLRRAKLELFGLNYQKLTKWQKRALERQEDENDDRN